MPKICPVHSHLTYIPQEVSIIVYVTHRHVQSVVGSHHPLISVGVKHYIHRLSMIEFCISIDHCLKSSTFLNTRIPSIFHFSMRR
jgi:hypothetical protein